MYLMRALVPFHRKDSGLVSFDTELVAFVKIGFLRRAPSPISPSCTSQPRPGKQSSLCRHFAWGTHRCHDPRTPVAGIVCGVPRFCLLLLHKPAAAHQVLKALGSRSGSWLQVLAEVEKALFIGPGDRIAESELDEIF